MLQLAPMSKSLLLIGADLVLLPGPENSPTLVVNFVFLGVNV